MGEPPRSTFTPVLWSSGPHSPTARFHSRSSVFERPVGAEHCGQHRSYRQGPRPQGACGLMRASQSCNHSDDCPSTSPAGELFPSVSVRAQVPSQSDESPEPVGLHFRASVSTSVTWAARSLPPRSANEVVEGTVSGPEPGFLQCSKGGGSSALLPLPPANSARTHPASCLVPGSWLLQRPIQQCTLRASLPCPSPGPCPLPLPPMLPSLMGCCPHSPPSCSSLQASPRPSAP